MAQRMDAQGSGDPFDYDRGSGNDINMLRTAADGLKLVAGGMRKQRLDALEADLEYQERKARKANKKARIAVKATDPAVGTVSQAANHAAQVALLKAQKANQRADELRNYVDHVQNQGETYRMIDGAAGLAADFGVGSSGGSGGGGGEQRRRGGQRLAAGEQPPAQALGDLGGAGGAALGLLREALRGVSDVERGPIDRDHAPARQPTTGQSRLCQRRRDPLEQGTQRLGPQPRPGLEDRRLRRQFDWLDTRLGPRQTVSQQTEHIFVGAL